MVRVYLISDEMRLIRCDAYVSLVTMSSMRMCKVFERIEAVMWTHKIERKSRSCVVRKDKLEDPVL